jgi:DNA polymerase III subunit beta
MTTTTIEGTTVEQVTALLVPVDVLRELATVAVAAGKDDTLPTLTGVRLEWGPEGLDAVATDRYRLAHAYWGGNYGRFADSLLTGTPEGAALLPAKELVAYVKSLPKASKRGTPALVAIRPEADGVRFTCDTGDGEVSRMIPTLDGEFPRWASLLPTEWGAVEAIAMDPKYLADVAKMPRVRGASVRVRFTMPTRPMVWSGEGECVKWQYLLMPMRTA